MQPKPEMHLVPHLIAAVLASLVATAACSSKDAPSTAGQTGSAAAGSATAAGSAPAGSAAGSAAPTEAKTETAAAKPGTPSALVEASAPKGSKVAPAELKVPGVELFVVTGSEPVADGEYAGGTLVGVAGGKVVDGRELVLAAIAAKAPPPLIAKVALWVAQRDSEGTILDAATTRAQKKAKASGPVVKKNALMFWVATTEEPKILEVGKVDLTTGLVELEPPAMSHEAAVSNAILTLQGDGVSRYPSAIKTLVTACKEPRARGALFTALSTHPRERTRTAIANQAHKCGAPVVAPLINLMQDDKSAMVRSEAASALGRTGDPRARQALARAARGEDANLAWAAKNALTKLQ